MRIDDLPRRSGEWLKGTGPESDIVISSRIRLARNLQGFPFHTRLDDGLRGELAQRLREGIESAGLPESANYVNLADVDPIDCMLLVERHLISREHAEAEGDRGVAFSDAETVAIMTIEEDHLRIQVMRPGLDLEPALQSALDVDRKLEASVPYAFDDELGFLTACPTNVGTGLRISVMLHLPGLVLGEQIDKVFQSASRVGLTVRGSHGEGTKATGDVLQLAARGRLEWRDAPLGPSPLTPRRVHYEVTGGWRMALELRRTDGGKPAELRAFLRMDNNPVSETWSYVLPID